MLFIRGKAMSGAPIISGTIQLPKPPIIAGITMKKIMIRPCAVTNTLKVCESWKNWTPGLCSSIRIAIDRIDRMPQSRKQPGMTATAAGHVDDLERPGFVPRLRRGWPAAGLHAVDCPRDLRSGERQHVDASEGIQGVHVLRR